MSNEERPAPKVTTVGQTRVRWEDSKMRTSYANVCNVASTKEEVMVLFGTSQTWMNTGEEVTVELSDRILLNPHAAKRLLGMLAKAVEEYERNFGALG